MTYPQPPRSHPPIEPRKRRTWPWIVGGALGGLILIVAIAAACAPTVPTPNYPARSVTPATVPAIAVPPPPPAPPATPAAPAGPRTTFGEGTWEVGVDIAPGKYKTTGTSGYGCYYARLKTGDGSMGDIIDNNISQGPATVTIKSTDGYFETNGCDSWVLTP